ncbi:intraflagellar transport protein 81-like protein [Lasius niger]|uniref:Intraflagellar transport protein 81-like protein n=2 Tax=Lasius TaxID=488720 RepID=A0A0J7NCQ1_LASNI|nr:intraflagellar transport protein 81-like protein [Lasius niger]
MKNTTSDLLSETKQLKDKLLKSIEKKKRLQQKIAKMKITEEKIKSEIETNIGFNNVEQILKQELQKIIMLEEEALKNLDKEQEKIKEYIIQYENQTQQWNNIIS